MKKIMLHDFLVLLLCIKIYFYNKRILRVEITISRPIRLYDFHLFSRAPSMKNKSVLYGCFRKWKMRDFFSYRTNVASETAVNVEKIIQKNKNSQRYRLEWTTRLLDFRDFCRNFFNSSNRIVFGKKRIKSIIVIR